MKVLTMAVLITLGASVAVPAFAEDDCKISLCMFGLLNGQNDSTCKGAIADYFGILVYKHGNVKWSQTATKRLSQLNSCPGADSDKMKEVNNKFGKSWGA